MNEQNIACIEIGMADVTSRGLLFLGRRYSARRMLVERWFERALTTAAVPRQVPVYYAQDGNCLYIKTDEVYEQLRELPFYNVTDEQRERYYEGMQLLKQQRLQSSRHAY